MVLAAMNQLGLHTDQDHLAVAAPGDEVWVRFAHKASGGRYRLQRSTEVWRPNESCCDYGVLHFRRC